MSLFEAQALLASPRVSRADLDRLVAAGLLQPKHYLEVVEERVAARRCGFPVCQEKLGPASPSDRLVLDPVSRDFVSHRSSDFCCPECERQSGVILRLVESSAHFGSPTAPSSSLEELLQTMGAVDDPELPPPRFASAALSATGRASLEGQPAPAPTAGRPMRLRQLRRKVLEESGAFGSTAVPRSAPQPHSVDELSPSRDTSTHSPKAEVTFATLNYRSLIRPLAERRGVSAPAPRGRLDAAPARRGAKVVSWSEDVKAPAPSQGGKEKTSKPLVGAVIDRTSELAPLGELGVSRGIEGYETRVERISRPSAEESPGTASEEREGDSETDSDSPSLEDFPLDTESHYASLNLFAILWLVSDDILGGLLPLNMNFEPSDSDSAADISENDLSSSFPEFNRGKSFDGILFYRLLYWQLWMA